MYTLLNDLAAIAEAKENMIKVTFQKNVLVYAPGDSFTTNYKKFFEWLKENDVKEFIFRPSDKENEALVKARSKKVEKAGYKVEQSGVVHHFMKASK